MRQQSRQPDGRPVGWIKRATLMEYLLKKRELTDKGQKAARQRKIPLVRKSYSLYLWVRLQKGVMVLVKMMMSENQSSQAQVHVTAFRGTEG
jgi:hypothetical protein